MTSTESTVQTDESAQDWAYGVGDVLEDRYEIVERIAQGAFGEVHAARDRREDRRVALKVLRVGSEKRDPKAVARMRQEAEILRALDHPNLVQVHDIAEVDGRECLVMELLEGESLRQRIDANNLASVDELRPVAGQILSALEAMHRRGVRHRDLKPDNIILLDAEDADGGEVKLVDFGIAKARDFLDQDHEQTLVQTQDDGFVGTPQYAAPEQAVGDPIDATSDLFSLGLVLAEWFTGEPRISASGRRGVVSILIQPEPLEVSDCPDSWQSWLQKMMAKTPEDRFQSAAEALEALPGSGELDLPELEAEREFDGSRTIPDSEANRDTLDLAPPETEENTPVGQPGDPEEPTVVESPAAADSGTAADEASPPSSEAKTVPKADEILEDAPGASGPQRSRSWQQRDEVGYDDETASPTQSARESSSSSKWLTAAAFLFFLFSLALFLYSLLEVLP